MEQVPNIYCDIFCEFFYRYLYRRDTMCESDEGTNVNCKLIGYYIFEIKELLCPKIMLKPFACDYFVSTDDCNDVIILNF